MIEKLFILSPEEAHEAEQQFRIVRRSLDARHREMRVNLTILCDDEERPLPKDAPIPLYEPPVFQTVTPDSPTVRIVGCGPAGLFAALTLLEHGIRPIIYERGQEIAQRKRDIARLNRGEGFEPESNYCFGEGGAGTFSDGKLFSRSKKRGNMQRVMQLFHYFGAPDSVLYEAHAHIGSDLLPNVIRNMCACIREHGGEIHFGMRMDRLSEMLTPGRPCILAIGHSAHDTYRMLAASGVTMEAKGFALGVRVEHPQEIINRIMYHRAPREVVEMLGNAAYSINTRVRGRGVYSFCMCPGGHIVPAGSQADGCVVNGMSASHRNSPFANSGIVVEVPPRPEWSALDALEYQEQFERLAAEHGGPHNECPAQRLRDFVDGRTSGNEVNSSAAGTNSSVANSGAFSTRLSSYLPGIVWSRLDEWLPREIGERLQQGFLDFNVKYHGYLTNRAIIHGVESRSSSPVRIVRDPETMQSVSHPGLYPVGEGAGYAGGITSSALDGINAAMKIINNHNS